MAPALGQVRQRVLVVKRFLVILFELPAIPGQLEEKDREINRLLLVEHDRAQLEQENAQLRRLVNAPTPVKPSHIIGEIIGSVPGSFGARLIVSLPVGSVVDPSEAVYGQGNVFGRVVEVKGLQLLVEPLTSPTTAMAVTIGEGGAVGLLHGANGGAVVEDISAAFAVAADDVVRVAAGDETFALGAIIGRVKQVQGQEGNFLKRAIVELSAQPRSTRFVELVGR
ncbi:hypothetical protein HYZ64_01710 [Candidatus Berkelbacteria bacterium]|nr:hypothetical protein [Candidatus Berkelbacteria bacterium]